MIVASALFPAANYLYSKVVQSPRDLNGVDILVLHGGADISTSIYNKPRGMSTSTEKLSQRDIEELSLAKVAIRKGIPILGICRGAQLMCCLSGGSLWQHVHNHNYGFHDITFRGEEYVTNSCHHQMMIPPEDAIILATCKNQSPQKYKDGSIAPVLHEEDEPEIVYFPKVKALGVQGHPEWLKKDDDLNIITNQLVKEFLNVELTCRG